MATKPGKKLIVLRVDPNSRPKFFKNEGFTSGLKIFNFFLLKYYLIKEGLNTKSNIFIFHTDNLSKLKGIQHVVCTPNEQCSASPNKGNNVH